MRRVGHRVALEAAREVGGHDAVRLLADLAGPAALADLAERAAPAVHVVGVLGLGVDGVAEFAGEELAAAEHRLRAVAGRLAEHVVAARAERAVDDLLAPVEALVVVRDADDGDGAVDVLAGLHRLERLRGVEPGLRDDRDGVAVRLAEVVERGKAAVLGELLLDQRVLRPLLDFRLLRVAEKDGIDAGMRGEERREAAAE